MAGMTLIKPLTEKTVQELIFRHMASSHAPLLPNYTPVKWFECDVFSVTKKGFFHEHEIKLSVADFKKDAEKADRFQHWRLGTPDWPAIQADSKHVRLANGDPQGPAYFWFVMPEDVADKVTIPDFAGLKVVRFHRSFYSLRTRKTAPRLHNRPCEQQIVTHAFRVCYWRFWKERIALEHLKRQRTNFE